MSASHIRLLGLLAATALGACAQPPGPAPAPPAAQTGEARLEHDRGDASVYGLYLAGEAAIDRGSSRDAAFYFARASGLDPASEPLRSRAFTAALVAGQVPEAAALAAGLGDAPQPVGGLARLVRGVEALSDGRDTEALTLLAEPPIPAPHGAAAALLAPWAAQAAGVQPPKAAPSDLASNPVLATIAALGSAERLELAGKNSDAEAVYKAHLAGKSGLFILGYGGFLERRGRRAEAVALYDRSLAARPDDAAVKAARARAAGGKPPPPAPDVRTGAAEALLAPAIVLLADHQGDSGLGYLRLALRLDPKLDEAWILVGDAMSTAGDQKAASEAYSHVKAGSDQYAAARGDLAIALQREGDKEGALSVIRQTLAGEPKNVRLLTLLADLLSEDERYPEAVEASTEAISAMPEGKAPWSLYFTRGAAEERAGRWPEGEADLKKALALSPDEPEVMNYLGYAWIDRGQHLPEAVALLERAEAKEPESGAIVDSLGWARFKTKDYPSALLDLERAVQLDPSDPEVNDHLGDIYWQVGRRLEAVYQWRRVLTLNPDAKRRAAVEAKLAERGAIAPAEPERVAAETDRRP